MDETGCRGCGIVLGPVVVVVVVAAAAAAAVSSSRGTLAQVERTPADGAYGGRGVEVAASPGSPGAGWEGEAAVEGAGAGTPAAPRTGCWRKEQRWSRGN